MKRLFLSIFLTAALAVAMIPATVAAVASCPAGAVAIGISLTKGQNCIQGDPNNGGVIIAYLKGILQFLSAGIGIVVILMIVIAGVQYIISAGDPGNIKAAKDRIVNAITALILFVMGYAILSFIVPGGIF